MGLFGKKKAPPAPVDYNDLALDDAAWLRAGERRYSELVKSHYGSPDTIAAGGSQRLAQSDPAAALYFFQKAIDTMHSIYVIDFTGQGPSGWSRRPSANDIKIADSYVQALVQVRRLRPGAPIGESVMEVTHRLRTISTSLSQHGFDSSPYLAELDDLAQAAPDVDVSGVFWS